MQRYELTVVIERDEDGRYLAICPPLQGCRTKTAAVKRALEEFIARREQGKIVELFGSLEWDPEYDYKAARSRR